MTAPDHRLLFLGAGFSRSAGLPLANELLALALGEIRRHFPGATKLDKSLDRYRRYVHDTTGASSDPIDIEQFCAFLDHEHVLGLRGSDTWSRDGNEDQLMLRWGIGAALHRATPAATDLPDHYLRFASELRPGDCVVSFNYDRLLEDAMAAIGTPFRRFPMRYTACHKSHSEVDRTQDSTEVLILKVHGSIDWIDRSGFESSLHDLEGTGAEDSFRKRNLLFGATPITTCRPLVDGPRPENDPLRTIMVLDDLDSYYANLNVWHHAAPLILAPSEMKLLYGAPIREFWAGMPLYAWSWSGLGVVGYSLPPADPYARQVLWSIGTSYGDTFGDSDWSLAPKRRIKIIDYRRTEDETQMLRESYRFLDQRLTDYHLDGFDDSAVTELFAS